MVEISGASAAQEAVLRDVLAGFPSTAIEALAVEPYDGLEFAREPGSPPWTPTPAERDVLLGVALRLVAPGSDSTRAVWEVDLVAGAFRARSASVGPEKVLSVLTSSGGHGLDRPRATPAGRGKPIDVSMLRDAASSIGDVERLDVGECEGPVVTLILRVDEPHQFMRHQARPLLETAGVALRGASASYVEVRDGDPRPIVIRAHSPRFGMRYDRHDVDCCNRLMRHRIAVNPAPEKLPCPVFADRVEI